MISVKKVGRKRGELSMKKFISVLLTAIIAFSAFSAVSVSASTAVINKNKTVTNGMIKIWNGDYECGDYGYRLLNDDTAEIMCYLGKDKELYIPSEVDGHKVTSIGNEAFYSNTRIENVIIPDTVINLEKYAFSDCWNLKNISIPDSVISIGGWAFDGCTCLESIIIPDSVTNIGEYSFGYNYKNKIDGFTIYGYRGTAAEEYANENGFEFIDLDKKEIIGDVNGDGKLSVADATVIQKYLADLIDLTAEQLSVADANGNGVVNVFDATAIQSLLVS